MILIDAGPLVALVDADDQYHEKCVDCLKSLREPLVTVWPPLVEAVYLLEDLPKAREAVWEMLARGAVRLLTLVPGRHTPHTRTHDQVCRPPDGSRGRGTRQSG